MPVFRLDSDLIFPPPQLAEANGLLAVGGDLSPERLLLAYSMGIFPWFTLHDPLLWWSPEPRCIFLPESVHVSRSLRKTVRRADWQFSFDRAFVRVMESCAAMRDESWITPQMLAAYVDLHRRGYAHSVECWEGEQLVGGLYGVALGRCFCGESMFHTRRDASKATLMTALATLFTNGYRLVDAQLPTPHLQSLGGVTISRERFLQLLRKSGVTPSRQPPAGAFPQQPVETWAEGRGNGGGQDFFFSSPPS